MAAKSKNEVLVEFAGDADKLQREAREATQALDNFGDKARRVSNDTNRHLRELGREGFDKVKGFAMTGGAALGAGIAAGIAGGVAAGIALAKSSFDAFVGSETSRFRMEFQFNQNGLGPFIQDFQDFNSELMKTIPFDDDALAEAQGVLSRVFGTPEEVRRYTRLAADLSAVTGRDLVSSAGALVKASAGSTRLLKEFGIDLDQLGDEGEDASEIFALLEEKVGGAAEELGRRAPGQLEIAKNRFGEISEEIGGHLSPALLTGLDLIAGWAEDIIAGAGSVGEAFEDLGLDTTGLEQTWEDLKEAYDAGLKQVWEDLKGWVEENKDELQDFIDDVVRLAEVAIPIMLAALKAGTSLWLGIANAIIAAVDALREFVDFVEESAPWIAGGVTASGATAGGSGANGPKAHKAPRLFHAGSGGALPGAPGMEVPFIGLAGERVTSAHSERMVLEIRSGGSRTDDFLVDLLARAADRTGGNLQLAVSRR